MLALIGNHPQQIRPQQQHERDPAVEDDAPDLERKVAFSIMNYLPCFSMLSAHHQNDVAQNVAVLEHEIIDLAEAVEELLPQTGRRFRVCSRTCLIALLCLRLFLILYRRILWFVVFGCCATFNIKFPRVTEPECV